MLINYIFESNWGTSGLVGTLGVTVTALDGVTVLIPRTTSGITDLTGGFYLVTIPNWDISWKVFVEIDDTVTTTQNTHSLQTDLNPANGPIITASIASYSLPSDADTYFGSRLYGTNWISISDVDQKQLALNDATRIINRFAYLGWKTNCNQDNEWPRSGILRVECNIIPKNIYEAQYEIAYSLLVDQIDIQQQLARTAVTSRRFAGVATTYDTKNIPEYLTWGVPCWLAWSLLTPYIDLSKSEDIRLNRIS